MSTLEELPTDVEGSSLIRLDGTRRRALDVARNRLVVTGLVFMMAFLVMAFRLVDLTAFSKPHNTSPLAAVTDRSVSRGIIYDRNGVMLATSLETSSLYVDPRDVFDPEATATALARIFPDMDRASILSKLTASGRWHWLRRNLRPQEKDAVNRLGVPGLRFESEYRRIYTRGRSAAHVLGVVNVDGKGIAGIEQAFDASLANGEDIHLALDLRVQEIMRKQLEDAKQNFNAVGAFGTVIDVATGEVLAMVSLPDFDPNDIGGASDDAKFNRMTSGVYEMGSVMKLLTVSMALDSGTTTLERGYDASHPIKVSRFTITDYHPENRWLSVPEIIVHSSNIGSALMARDVGGTLQREYLHRFGILGKPEIEIPEAAQALPPNPWRDLDVMTVGFGHSLATTPIQVATAIAAIADGGVYHPATLLRHDGDDPLPGRRVISARTAAQVRALMRLVVQYGTGTKADVPGYEIGGKTGTAEKLVNGRYQHDRRMSTFVGAFPIRDPRYVVLASLDEPKGNRATYNYATAGWVAAPIVANVVTRMAPLLGIQPVEPLDTPTTTAAAKKDIRHDQLMIAVRQLIANSRGQRFAAN